MLKLWAYTYGTTRWCKKLLQVTTTELLERQGRTSGTGASSYDYSLGLTCLAKDKRLFWFVAQI